MSLSDRLKLQLCNGRQLVRRKAVLLGSCLEQVVTLLSESADVESDCLARQPRADACFKLCKRSVFELKRQALDVSAKIDEIERRSNALPDASRASLALMALSRVAVVYRQALKCLQMYVQMGCLDGEAVLLFGRLLSICVTHVSGLMARVDSSYHSSMLDVQKVLSPLNGRMSAIRWRCLVHGLFENIDVDAFSTPNTSDSPAFPEVLLTASRASGGDFKLYQMSEFSSESGVNDLSVLSSHLHCDDGVDTAGINNCCRRGHRGRCDNQRTSGVNDEYGYIAVKDDPKGPCMNDNLISAIEEDTTRHPAVGKGSRRPDMKNHRRPGIGDGPDLCAMNDYRKPAVEEGRECCAMKEYCHPVVEEVTERCAMKDYRNPAVEEGHEYLAVKDHHQHLVSKKNDPNPVVNWENFLPIIQSHRHRAKETGRSYTSKEDQRHFTMRRNHSHSSTKDGHQRPDVKEDNHPIVSVDNRGPPTVNGDHPHPVWEDCGSRPAVNGGRLHTALEDCGSRPAVNGGRLHPVLEDFVSRPAVNGDALHSVLEDCGSRPAVNGGRLHPASEDCGSRPAVNGGCLHPALEDCGSRPAVNGDHVHPVSEDCSSRSPPTSNRFTHAPQCDAGVDNILREFVVSNDVTALLVALMQQEASLVNSIVSWR